VSVIALDLPAHGLSPGETATIPQLATAVRAVAEACPPIHALIAHSMGSAVSTLALSRGLEVERIAFISAPARYRDQAKMTADKSGLDDTGWVVMEQLLIELGTELNEVDLPALAPQLRQKALLIHSIDDRVVAIADSRETAARWPGAAFQEVDRLGHNRILRDPDVISLAVGFVASRD
jgi:pimeloyl-ACP methyl ester carboxylesterase